MAMDMVFFFSTFGSLNNSNGDRTQATIMQHMLPKIRVARPVKTRSLRSAAIDQYSIHHIATYHVSAQLSWAIVDD
jgi:hypothetical protein